MLAYVVWDPLFHDTGSKHASMALLRCREMAQEGGPAGLRAALAVLVQSADAVLPAGADAESALVEDLTGRSGSFDARQQPGFWPLIRAGLVRTQHVPNFAWSASHHHHM